jgi:hypothetical protein
LMPWKKPFALGRLQNFVNKTADNKMFGNWNDGGRLL